MALVIYAREILLALDVRPASDHADQSLADLAAPAILVPSAQRFADTRRIAAFVAQAVRVRGAHGRADAAYARCPRPAVSVRLTDRPG